MPLKAIGRLGSLGKMRLRIVKSLPVCTLLVKTAVLPAGRKSIAPGPGAVSNGNQSTTAVGESTVIVSRPGVPLSTKTDPAETLKPPWKA